MGRGTNACIVWFSLCLGAILHNTSFADTGEPVEFTIRRVSDGSLFSSADHKDKCMVIIFGSIYCKPCVEMIPVINRLQETFKNDKFIALGIDIDTCSEDEKLRRFSAEQGIRFQFLVDSTQVAKKYKVFMLPTTLIVDPGGTVVKRYTNVQSYTTLEKQVRKCLAEKQGEVRRQEPDVRSQ